MLARLALSVATVPLLGACVVEGGGPAGEGAPRLTSVSLEEVRVGQRLELLGEDLAGEVAVRFEGEFAADDGSLHAVDVTLRPQRVGADRLVLPYFGPYQVPFGDGDRIGTFTGTVTPLAGDLEGAPLDLVLAVAPSVIVRELASEERLCNAPSALLIGGGSLHIVAEAIGFDATSIEVRLGDAGPVAAAGAAAGLPIPALADGTLYAVTELGIAARAADGGIIASEYLIGVHQAIEYVDLGAPKDMQIEEAVPVSGCFAGGSEGQSLVFGEQAVDLRNRGLHFGWNQDWLDENGQIAEPERVAEVGLRRVLDGPALGPDTETWTVGYAGSEHTDVAPLAPGPAGIWQASSSDMVADASGEIPRDEFGVWYRQATRVSRPGALVERNTCGEAVMIAEATVIDYRWAVDLATAAECPPFPLPDLPAAECLMPPCD